MQMALEGAKQKPAETTAAYIRRFVIDADRAYPTTRSASDEVRVVSSLLKGLIDCKLVGQVCDADEVDTLADASKVALAKEAKRETREQMIGHDDGHEPMELGSAHQDRDGQVSVHHGYHAKTHGTNADTPAASRKPHHRNTSCLTTTPASLKHATRQDLASELATRPEIPQKHKKPPETGTGETTLD